MGNENEKEEGGELKQDEIPRDTQLDHQYIESPSVQDNQQPQPKPITEVNQEMKNYVIQQGNSEGYITQQGIQIQSPEQYQENIINQREVMYQDDQMNQQYYDNQGQENIEYQMNQGIEGNQNLEEMEANQEIQYQMDENDGQENYEIEGEGEEEMVPDNNEYQMNQEGMEEGENNLINKQSKSYQVNRDGKIYNVNEESGQYQINSADHRYQFKKEYKTTKIENNIETNQNNTNYNNQHIEVERENDMRKNIKVVPKNEENYQRTYVQTSSGYYDNFPKARYTQYYSDIPRFMSFQRSTLQNQGKIRSSVNIERDEENISELIEIPRAQYDSYAGRETIYIGGGMDTGEYKFQGQGIIITHSEAPQKIVISEEEILKEINRRKNKPKKEKQRRYEILDKFYAITEFDGKPIKKIEKIEQQQKQQFEYQEKQFYSSSQGNAEYQFSSKEFQSQNMQGNNSQSQFSQQYQFQQSQMQPESQTQQINLKMNQDESSKMKMKYANFKDLSSSFSPNSYCQVLLDSINKLRTDPQSYISIIEEAKKNIIKDKHGRLIYNGKIKVALNKGEAAFNSAIEYLKTIKPVDKLEFNPYLTVEMPKTENEIKYKNDLRLKVDNMINNGINIKSFWRDIIKDPEISFLMMIVDDNSENSGMRRKDLLDSNMKYIGINSIEINGHFICYLTLGTA